MTATLNMTDRMLRIFKEMPEHLEDLPTSRYAVLWNYKVVANSEDHDGELVWDEGIEFLSDAVEKMHEVYEVLQKVEDFWEISLCVETRWTAHTHKTEESEADDQGS